MVTRVPVAPGVLAWAVDRSGRPAEEISQRFPALPDWETGQRQPTLKQLEGFANATHTPVGFLLLPTPPEESLPIADYRTMEGVAVGRPSADLLDTIYLCQQRQDWYRDWAVGSGEGASEFVGALDLGTPWRSAAQQVADWLGYDMEVRQGIRNWSDALGWIRDSAENNGILVMISGVVGSNTHRKLDPREFRGFSLSDPVAPLLFVNGSDTKAAQIFSIMHEICHLWLGESGVSNAPMNRATNDAHERWCNEVAAEVLVPSEHLLRAHQERPLRVEIDRLARLYKVSTLVVLRRLRDIGRLSREEFSGVYEDELARLLALMREGTSRGHFYNTQPVRVSKRFARAIVMDTLEGQTLHRDAYRLLGFKKHSTFVELSQRLGIA